MKQINAGENFVLIEEKDKPQPGVLIGEYSRGGKTRGNNQAQDHDLGGTEKYIPFGLVDEDSGQRLTPHS